ncbi:MAG: hypothetical protein JEZ09_14255 [Salinivirgaceae bacterium]|nr:hypothetical protein [Salinivirgaceae bacterium]
MAMKEGLDNKDWNALYKAVHKMIPSFSIVGISAKFEDMAKKVQEFASNQKELEGIPEMVLQLETVCEHACEELQVEYCEIEKTN